MYAKPYSRKKFNLTRLNYLVNLQDQRLMLNNEQKKRFVWMAKWQNKRQIFSLANNYLRRIQTWKDIYTSPPRRPTAIDIPRQPAGAGRCAKISDRCTVPVWYSVWKKSGTSLAETVERTSVAEIVTGTADTTERGALCLAETVTGTSVAKNTAGRIFLQFIDLCDSFISKKNYSCIGRSKFITCLIPGRSDLEVIMWFCGDPD